MDYILIIISSLLGVLGILVEPVRKGEGSVFKRLRLGGFVILSLIILTFILSVTKLIIDEIEARKQEQEAEYWKLKPTQIGPGFNLIITFKDSLLFGILNNKNRSNEILGLNIDKGMKGDFFKFYMDSISRHSLLDLCQRL